ncbi:MAG: peptidase C15 [Cyanobacteria bacterium J06560_2]
MAPGPLLITSFQPWRSHQLSNSSDDLIAALQSDNRLPEDCIWSRNVPVSFELAPIRVISEVCKYRPRAVVCCGMAERRAYLSVERQAVRGENCLITSANVTRLLQKTQLSVVSEDAGSYVCNALYYSVLESIERYKLPTAAIFVHVPILSAERKRPVLEDFMEIVSALAS